MKFIVKKQLSVLPSDEETNCDLKVDIFSIFFEQEVFIPTFPFVFIHDSWFYEHNLTY